jgi:hypothetical protein
MPQNHVKLPQWWHRVAASVKENQVRLGGPAIDVGTAQLQGAAARLINLQRVNLNIANCPAEQVLILKRVEALHVIERPGFPLCELIGLFGR